MYQPIDPDTADFIQRLPKTETHLHIEGALPYELLKKLDPEKFRDPPLCQAPDFRWKCFKEFENYLIEYAMQWFTSPERYYEAAQVIFSKHLEQNVRYVEISFHAGMIEFLGIPGPEIINAIRSAVPRGSEVRIFMGMAGNSYTESLAPALEACVNWAGLAGIDLHGVESLPMEDWTRRLWEKARAHGLETKAHAGEFAPAAHVREAIELLGTRRIQHGVRAVEDEAVMKLALRSEVTFDICPISNLKLGVVESMKDHPIREFFDRSLRCTISTDDPFAFGNTIADEYAALSADLAFTNEELKQIAQNGFEVALVDEATRSRWMEELRAV